MHFHCWHRTGKEENKNKRFNWIFNNCRLDLDLWVELKCCICNKIKWKKYKFWC